MFFIINSCRVTIKSERLNKVEEVASFLQKIVNLRYAVLHIQHLYEDGQTWVVVYAVPEREGGLIDGTFRDRSEEIYIGEQTGLVTDKS